MPGMSGMRLSVPAIMDQESTHKRVMDVGLVTTTTVVVVTPPPPPPVVGTWHVNPGNRTYNQFSPGASIETTYSVQIDSGFGGGYGASWAISGGDYDGRSGQGASAPMKVTAGPSGTGRSAAITFFLIDGSTGAKSSHSATLAVFSQ